MTREDLLALRSILDRQLRSTGLNAVADNIEASLLPSIRLLINQPDGARERAPRSKLGGRPDLPTDLHWPTRQGVPLAFVAQLSLEELWHSALDPLIPRVGTLFFFYDAWNQPWGYDPADRGSWEIIYHTIDSRALRPAEAPDAIAPGIVFREAFIRGALEWTLPSIDAETSADPEFTRRELEAYWSVLDNFRKTDELQPVHRFLGHPDSLQGDMRLQSQLASHGVYVGDARGFDSSTSKELAEGAKEWQLLLQVDSAEDLDMHWGDGGRLYYWIPRADLRRLHFDSTWAVLQCT